MRNKTIFSLAWTLRARSWCQPIGPIPDGYYQRMCLRDAIARIAKFPQRGERLGSPGSSTPQSPETPQSLAAAGVAALDGKLSTIENGPGKRIIVVTGGDSVGSQVMSAKIFVADNGYFHATANNGAPTLLLFPGNAVLTGSNKPTVGLGAGSYPVGSSVKLTGQAVTQSAQQLVEIAPCVPHVAVFQVASIK